MSSGSLTVMGIIAAAVSVTAGLLWNDAIQSSIALWFPNQVNNNQPGQIIGKPSVKAIITKFSFAFIFTILLVIFVMWISKAIDRFIPSLRSLKTEF